MRPENKIIAIFMGHFLGDSPYVVGDEWYRVPKTIFSEGYRSTPVRYDQSWDYLMEAVKKWDELSEHYEPFQGDTVLAQIYRLHSDEMDMVVTTYDTERIYKKLIYNIEFYNRVVSGLSN